MQSGMNRFNMVCFCAARFPCALPPHHHSSQDAADVVPSSAQKFFVASSVFPSLCMCISMRACAVSASYNLGQRSVGISLVAYCGVCSCSSFNLIRFNLTRRNSRYATSRRFIFLPLSLLLLFLRQFALEQRE